MLRAPSLRLLWRPENAIFLLWLFLLVFPKGGIKIGPVPLTWGYLWLGVAATAACLRRKWSVPLPRLRALLLLLPFQLICLWTVLANGTENPGWTIALFISFFFTPYAFLLLFSEDIETMDLARFFRLFKKGVAFISYYGIFLFIYKQLMGKYLEIPLLTINWGDLGMLDDFKCNSRGLVSKLISTYNNGQLFGISLSMLLPLYCYLQANKWHRWAAKLAVLLTLSRTAWIGLLFHEFFYGLLVEKSKKKALWSLLFFLSLFTGAAAAFSWAYGLDLNFFLDGNFGGRRDQLTTLQEWSFFPAKPFSHIQEMVYIAILSLFGVFGLLAYLLAMAGPLVSYFELPRSKERLAILLGLLNYLFISISDGATLYIPVLAFFWFLVSLLGRKSLQTVEG